MRYNSYIAAAALLVSSVGAQASPVVPAIIPPIIKTQTLLLGLLLSSSLLAGLAGLAGGGNAQEDPNPSP